MKISVKSIILPDYAVYCKSEEGITYVGMVTNENEFLDLCIQIKKAKVRGYYLDDGKDNRCEIDHNGVYDHSSFVPYPLTTQQLMDLI